jgi:integrase
MISEHKARLLAARPKIEIAWKSDLDPGLHAGPDGGQIAATERELTYYNHNGAFLRTEPNGGPAERIVGGPLTVHALAEAFTEPRPKAPTKNGDDAILETYLKHASITGHFENEARTVWALFKTLTNGVAIKDATRDDGRKLVAHFEAQELKSATIQKKIGWLTSAVNLAIKEGKLKFNPFSSIVPDRDDAEKRLPLDDADMKECKRNLDKLSDTDQVLWRLLACTGRRLSEAFQINGEATERGVRYCIVGTKTEQSLRRVPFPAGVLPYLPKKITGQLFALLPPSARQTAIERTAAAASKRLNRFIRDRGIVDPRKVQHSLRHRAKDRLRAAGCRKELAEEIFGRDEPTVGEGYGIGSPVPMLRKWADKIGF